MHFSLFSIPIITKLSMQTALSMYVLSFNKGILFQADKLANLVECKECRLKKGSCPKDGAVFELVPAVNVPQPLFGFIGKFLCSTTWFILSLKKCKLGKN